MTPEIVSIAPGLVAQRTIFGWVMSGLLPEDHSSPRVQSNVSVSHQLLCCDVSESMVRKFWDLESIGVVGRESQLEDPVMRDFCEKVQFVDGRYSVALPWKDESVRPRLLDNEQQARARLNHLSQRLSKNPELETRYHQVIQDMQQAGVIEEVPADLVRVPTGSLVYYMPHRPVVKESSISTKVRPVFDASAKGHNNVSLNDCLETGPSLIPDLLGILMRFRRWKFALCADITKAFLQVGVHPVDRDVHRFFWNDQGVTRVMRFTRVPFGNKSSPFLLNATIRYHLSQYPTSPVVEELTSNMYVDNWISGCDDHVQACDMTREARVIMNEAGMCLTQWGSNSTQVGELVIREFHDKCVEDGSLKVLGMQWLSSGDCFSFSGVVVPDDLCVTKRVVLSCIARLFDPLGFVTPFVMEAKILFQDLWRIGLGWDEVVPVDFQGRFRKWLQGLECIRQWSIPRSYAGYPWREVVSLELHGFGDSSERAYGACVYVRVLGQDGSWSASLVFSRARVAPLKRVSLPRLELLGALLCSRLVVQVREALKLPEDTVCHCWTDSTVALAWIKSDPHRWKPFVANRVTEIQSLTAPSQWHHVAGKDNPADLLTRGLSASELVQSDQWLHGPLFLSDDDLWDESEVCLYEGSSESEDIVVEEKQKKVITGPALLMASSVRESVFDIERWSSLTKAMRVIGWVLRFIKNAQCPSDDRVHGDLTFSELCRAKGELLRSVQVTEYSEELCALGQGQSVSKKSKIYKLSPFLGDDGLLRLQGRLQHSGLPEEEKHPVIIPKCHLRVLLARHAHVMLKHAGVNTMLVSLRDQYWLVGGRYVCKRVKKFCVSCQRQDVHCSDQAMAPLPRLRVTPSPPFAVSGLDHAGPLFCCDLPGKKFYVLLFTCAVTRALHLELVSSLSCEDTLMAVRRFASRRGMPSVLMSDNAKGFKAASVQKLKVLGPDGPEWKFIAPRAPWWGGWWKRLIRCVKSSLRKSVGNKSLTRVELETVLVEIEGILNSRPLTFVGDDREAGVPLTPSHFLVGRPVISKPAGPSEIPNSGADDLSLRLSYRNDLVEKFWHLWIKEYLRSLPPYRGPLLEDSLKVGSVVLIQDEGSPRLQWPLGVIQELYPGRDGHVRSVQVKTAKGMLIRPIQRLYHLKVNERIRDSVTNDLLSPVRPVTPVRDTHDPTHTPMTHMSINNDEKKDSGGTDPHTQNRNVTKMSRYGRVIKPRPILDM